MSGYKEVTNPNQYCIDSIKEYPTLFSSHYDILKRLFHDTSELEIKEGTKIECYVYDNVRSTKEIEEERKDNPFNQCRVDNAEWLCSLEGRIHCENRRLPSKDDCEFKNYNSPFLFKLVKGMSSAWYDEVYIYLDELTSGITSAYGSHYSILDQDYLKTVANFIVKAKEHIDNISGVEKEVKQRKVNPTFHEILKTVG